jgi:hypothetical protein
LKDDPGWEPWVVWLRDSYLKPLFAEAKIVNGIGDPAKWASLLDPAEFPGLRDRVDLDFAPTNPARFAHGDEASVEVFVKNVPKVMVKIYEINLLSFFLTQQRQLNTDLKLDGLIANREETHEFADPPLRRLGRTFKFPELKNRRGAWVVEFIGGGKASRALIPKGQWHLLQQIGPAGDMLTVLDEVHQPVKDAAVWLDGRKFTIDETERLHHRAVHRKSGHQAYYPCERCRGFRDAYEVRASRRELSSRCHVPHRAASSSSRAGGHGRHPPSASAQRSSHPLESFARAAAGDSFDNARRHRFHRGGEGPETRFREGFHSHLHSPRAAGVAEIEANRKVENLAKGGEKEDVSASDEWHLNGIDRHAGQRTTDTSRKLAPTTSSKCSAKMASRFRSAGCLQFHHREFDHEIDVPLRTDAKAASRSVR